MIFDVEIRSGVQGVLGDHTQVLKFHRTSIGNVWDPLLVEGVNRPFDDRAQVN